MLPRRWQFDWLADLRPFADGSAVRTSLVAGGGSAAVSQRAYSHRRPPQMCGLRNDMLWTVSATYSAHVDGATA